MRERDTYFFLIVLGKIHENNWIFYILLNKQKKTWIQMQEEGVIAKISWISTYHFATYMKNNPYSLIDYISIKLISMSIWQEKNIRVLKIPLN